MGGRLVGWIAVLLLLLSSPCLSPARALEPGEGLSLEALAEGPAGSLEERLRYGYRFHGLAQYLNTVNHYLLSAGSIRKMEEGERLTLEPGEWLAVAGRFEVLAVEAPGLSLDLSPEGLRLGVAEAALSAEPLLLLGERSALAAQAPVLGRLAYAHLWTPFDLLAKAMEAALLFLQSALSANWGLTVVIFAVLLKILLLPLAFATNAIQRNVSRIQASLLPRLAEIKRDYDGEEAHNRIMAAHRELGVTPFYALKPMFGLVIQVPILVAIFNALGEMPQFEGQSFLWIENLARPDSLGTLPFVIPWIGNEISLLPWVMTAVTVFSAFTYQNRLAPPLELRRHRRNVCLMALAFFLLFYPFPAAMVLFWALANLLQTVQQRFIKI